MESFLGFIQVCKKIEESITEDILRSLSKNNIDLSHCRGQSYDNEANIVGKWNGFKLELML